MREDVDQRNQVRKKSYKNPKVYKEMSSKYKILIRDIKGYKIICIYL